MSDERGLVYMGTDCRTALYRNITVSLEFAANELADLSEDHEEADRALSFIGDALKECWRLLNASVPPTEEA